MHADRIEAGLQHYQQPCLFTSSFSEEPVAVSFHSINSLTNGLEQEIPFNKQLLRRPMSELPDNTSLLT